MWVEKFQKIISFFLIFFLLFSFTLRVPFEIFFGQSAFAGNKDFFNLVSIIVDEESYDDLRGTIIRYSRDIQSQLENTKVVILPTPSDASALDIASLNESLFFEGYKSLEDVDYESRLIGTVLVGKIPLPIVFDDALSGKSILPYVDFENKSFIFNHESEKYEKSDSPESDLGAEIWHGVISPNTGNSGDDIDAIRDYFDKNHDYYTGQGVFNQDFGVIDGQDTLEPDDYEPYVFYYDQFRENAALQYQSYVGYEMYLQNIEDITYNRYSKELAEKVKDQVLGVQNADIYELLRQVDPSLDPSSFGDTGPDENSSSDILTRYITDNATKKFLEIFNGSTLGEMRKYVYNAGRYNDGGSRVNMDMPPFLISVLDQVSSEVIKNVNTSLENEITDLVANGLSQKIAIPTNRSTVSGPSTCSTTYTGFYYGTQSANINSAADCSIYRGNTSGTLVEANRGFNINNTDADIALCGPTMRTNSEGVYQGLEGYWGGNSPAGLSATSGGTYNDFYLLESTPKTAIRPIYDILGSNEIEDENLIPSPLNCFTDASLIMTFDERAQNTGGEDGDTICVTDMRAPVGGQSAFGWSCTTNNVAVASPSFTDAFSSMTSGFSSVADGGICYNTSLRLDGSAVKSNTQTCTGGGEDGCSCVSINRQNDFKTIPSYILHTSPTDEEFGAQIGSLFTPSLPIDSDRYIDFIGAKGGSAPDYGYQRIDFPQLFRVELPVGQDLTLENVEQQTKSYLDTISDQINTVIQNSNPSELSGTAQQIFNLLKTGEYPNADFDLYQILQDKPLEVFTSDNQSKEISYYDTLVFSIFWNNLDNVSSKYKFIFENYLSNQFEGNEYNFHLPKSKKSYETAYYAAPGDAQNMYVKLDPERKGNHPYADILSANLALNTTLSAANIEDPSYEEPTFECAPPDGVNIFQWIPAVICWLKNMLPPTIKITDGSCGVTPYTEEQLEEIAECSVDENANGIIDCLEDKLVNGSLLLYSDQGRYYYHTPGMLTTEIYDNDDEIAFFDNNSYIEHELIRLEIPDDSEVEFTQSNTRLIYDRDEKNSPEDYENAQRYISFNSSAPRAFRGKANTYFYGRGQDTNAYFSSTLTIDDAQGNRIVDLQSDTLRVEVRGDRMLIGSYKVENSNGEYFAGSDVRVSNRDNLCIADANNGVLDELADEAYSVSDAPEKLLLSIQNVSQNGNTLSLGYPLNITLLREGEVVYEEMNVSQNDLANTRGIFSAQQSGMYELYVTDVNGFRSYKRIDVFPDRAESLQVMLGSNILESGSNISTHFVSIFDRFQNIASSEMYVLDIEIQGDGVVFAENNAKNISYTLAEGYKAFRMKTTNDTGNVSLSYTLRDLGGNLVTQTQNTLRIVDDIRVNIERIGDAPKVGGGEYTYRLRFTDTAGNTYTSLNSRAYMNIEKLYGVAPASYTEIVNGTAEISFKTKTLAAEDIFLEFQLEGGNEIYKQYIDILPEDAIKIDLNLSKSKIEAAPEASTLLQATLKDRYNNDVFNNSSSVLTLELADGSNEILRLSDTSKTVSRGKAQFEISGTDIPGTGYFKVSATPDLSLTSFEIVGQTPFDSSDLTIPTMKNAEGKLTDTGKQFYRAYSDETFVSVFLSEESLVSSDAYAELSGVLKQRVVEFWRETNSLTVSGLSQNAGSIETFFFWDKEDIDGNAYNAYYSVLLGAEYGDISKENYLAGSMLFDRNNSSLAVTSLLNNPYSYSDSLSLERNGNIRVENTRDLTQDINLRTDIDSDGRVFVDVYNNALETYIGRIFYNLSSDEDITVNFIDESYGYNENSGIFRIENEIGQSVFEVTSEGKMKRKQGSYIEISPQNSNDLRFTLYHNARPIADIIIDQSFDINITRDSGLLENKLELLDDTMIFYIASNSYSSREVFDSSGETYTKLYYHDPFAVKYRLDKLHSDNELGLEASYDEAGIGWQDPNMMLLSFSSGESVGDASQNFQSFSLINLGDPTISLKPVRDYFPGTNDEKSFDSTLGEIISDEEGLVSYQVFDYNDDDVKDILTLFKDGYAGLYEGADIEGGFIRQRDLVFADDGGSPKLIKTGDFTGDGYGDIFFVSEKGQPELFNNNTKDFYRLDISEQLSLSGAIIQAEVFDMDSDGKDDIVTLDDAGEIHIFYGGGNTSNPSFTKKFVGDGYTIEIVEESQSYGGAIYYDGMTQIDPNNRDQLFDITQEYLQQMNQAIENGDEDAIPNPEFINDGLVQSLVYVEVPYVPTDFELPEINQESVNEAFSEQVSSLGENAQSQGVGETTSELSSFLSNYDQYIQYSGYQNTRNDTSYFLRSQYADTAGIEVSKIFIDDTPPKLQTGDTVYYDIAIKNTSSEIKENVAYVDYIPKYFTFASDEYTISGIEDPIPRKQGVGNFNILLDGIYLNPGEEITVRYELITQPLTYGHMQVGLYESGEVGDDIYGDIILKEDEKNCGLEAKIFRSTDVRSYVEGMTVPVCDESKIEIGNTFPELTDEDGNGVPDYLDDLLTQDSEGYTVPTNDNAAVQEYSQDALEDMSVDTDGDGVPDSDDRMDNTDSATDFMGALDQINAAVDDIAAEIDTLIEGFSCGFGGGSCFANPLNWAPLAPGNDPTLFGMPIGDGLRVGEGMPVFSALTGRQTSCGTSPCCLPSVFPRNSATFIPGPFCGPPGAGGSRGVTSPTNFVRMFVTPTLTGGAGIAVCFGAPALANGNIPPMGASPVVPGGNCIVAAMPLAGCEGGEGDPSGLGYPIIGDFGVIHANCDGNIGQDLVTPQELSNDFIEDYFVYLETGVMPAGMYDHYVSSFEYYDDYAAQNFTFPSEPLINIGGGTGLMSTSVDLDLSALGTGNLGDVVQIQNKRIGGFPNFLMDWVENQLDEVTSKLTNLPKIYVILPDFGGIFDGGFGDFGTGLQERFNAGSSERQENRTEQVNQQQALREARSSLDCSGSDALECSRLNLQIAAQGGENLVTNTNERLSGIKEVYEFIGNIPLVTIETQTIAVNVPWIDQSELGRFIADWEFTAEQWKNELESKSRSWSMGATCSGTPEEIENCQEQNDIRQNAYLEASSFISSLERNIEVLEEYKRFPEKLSKLINIKEVWLEQILCNIDAISKLMGEWINTNGERFKAWVELYMLIKAILKSWQLFIDVFNDYDAECHECKNERQDLNTFVFRLISAVIPSPPIIEFPKWPDIILDFHNIRAGITIDMPEFDMNMRPIVLPTLPDLTLPDVPSASFNLPELPVLPMFELPELPMLPSLPTVELPDLPPPPKIPKLFGPIEAVLNIGKLVTKAMCILKQSPFVPEWRAGDQIAFLTERNGYLPTDFIDIQMPAFSYSAISAIKVTTYVNLEFETEFIVEAVRAITAPIDKVTNNIVNMFDLQISDLDFSSTVPTSIDTNIELDGSTETDISLAPLDENPEGIYMIAGMMASSMLGFLEKLARDEGEMMEGKEFITYMNTQLSNPEFTADVKTQELRNLWSEMQQISYSKEDEFIADLASHNKNKFDTLKNIISTEIDYTQKVQQNLENSSTFEEFIQVDALSDMRIEEYNTLLEGYNISTLEAATALLNGESEEAKAFQEDLDREAKNLIKEVGTGFTSYRNNLLAAESSTSSSAGGSCIGTGTFEYNYEGIYVLEDGKNYKLFDYTEILEGDEIPTITDLDNDGDEDVLYLAAGKLFFKENRKQEKEKTHVTGVPVILKSGDNKFYNGDIYYEAVNGFTQGAVSDGAMNIEFSRPTDPSLRNFRLEYNTIVDRYLDDTDSFVPRNIQTHIVDAIAMPEKRPVIEENGEYIRKSHLATLKYTGAIRDIRLTNEKLLSVKNELAENRQVNLTSGTSIYAGDRDFEISYLYSGSDEVKTLRVEKYTQLEFKRPAQIISIREDAYISLGILEDIEDTDIIDYIGKPLLPGAEIVYTGNRLSLDESSHIDIGYYDGSDNFIDFREVSSYTLYDLGERLSDDMRIRILTENDFYYGRITPFKENNFGTLSRQILLSPQVYSDSFAPQIGLNQKIRIPVYQEQRIDLTSYIYEDGGLSGITDVRIDFDLGDDSDGDGNSRNDADSDNISINRTPASVSIDFGPYDEIFERNIIIAIEDDNGNVGEKEIGFEVYPPDPSIEDIRDNTISGAIDETLLDEPVRLYRYRGGLIQKLQSEDGNDVVQTDSVGNYSFTTVQTASGLTLSYSGSTIAEIDEYSGQIQLQDILSSVRVLPSNTPENNSIFPEIQILRSGIPIFSQYLMMPQGEPKQVTSFNDITDQGIYIRILNQSSFNSYRIPLGAPYNPGSLVVYRGDDSEKRSIMTIFQDGRIDINRAAYELIYRNRDNNVTLVLRNRSTLEEVAQVLYEIEASYVLD